MTTIGKCPVLTGNSLPVQPKRKKQQNILKGHTKVARNVGEKKGSTNVGRQVGSLVGRQVETNKN